MSKYIELNYNGKDICIRADYQDCRDGFNHVAELWVCGELGRVTAKIHYINRTWESYPFQSVIKSVICSYVESVCGVSNIFHTRKSENKVYKSLSAACRRDDRFRPLWDARRMYEDIVALAEGRQVSQQTIAA